MSVLLLLAVCWSCSAWAQTAGSPPEPAAPAAPATTAAEEPAAPSAEAPPPAPEKPPAGSNRAPFLLDAPPASAFISGKGWDRIEFANESEDPVVLKMYFHIPQMKKWREVRFPKDRPARPRFFKADAPSGDFEFRLGPGERVGWLRRNRNEMAFQVQGSGGNDISFLFRFRADRPTVAITRPDTWQRGEERAPRPSGAQGSFGSGPGGGFIPGMGPDPRLQGPTGVSPGPGPGSSEDE